MTLRTDIVWRSCRLSECMSDVIWPSSNAGHGWPDFQPCWNDRSVQFASYFALFWVCTTPESAFLYCLLLFCQGTRHFCGLWITELDIFFSVGKFLSDIWSGTLAFFVGHFEKCQIVRQVRQISTALRLKKVWSKINVGWPSHEQIGF